MQFKTLNDKYNYQVAKIAENPFSSNNSQMVVSSCENFLARKAREGGYKAISGSNSIVASTPTVIIPATSPAPGYNLFLDTLTISLANPAGDTGQALITIAIGEGIDGKTALAFTANIRVGEVWNLDLKGLLIYKLGALQVDALSTVNGDVYVTIFGAEVAA